jgi:ABC-2 type transport system permease protein
VTPPPPTGSPGAAPGRDRAGGLALSPEPGAAPRGARWRAQARLEWRLLMTNGEQVLLTLIIPVAVLLAVTRLGLAGIDEAAPGVMALAILSSAFTATAIATGFERRSGVLKFLGATPLGRSGLLVGKVAATLAQIGLQLVLIAGVAVALGWDPASAHLLALLALVVLATVALGSWGFALAGLLRAEATLAVANGIFLLLLFAGGTVLPADRLPAPIAAAVSLLPTAALGDGLRALLDPAVGTGLPLPGMAVLAGWAAAGIALSVRTFRWE